MTGVLVGRGEEYRGRHTRRREGEDIQEERHDDGVIWPTSKELHGLPATPEAKKRTLNRFSPKAFRESMSCWNFHPKLGENRFVILSHSIHVLCCSSLGNKSTPISSPDFNKSHLSSCVPPGIVLSPFTCYPRQESQWSCKKANWKVSLPFFKLLVAPYYFKDAVQDLKHGLNGPQ